MKRRIQIPLAQLKRLEVPEMTKNGKIVALLSEADDICAGNTKIPEGVARQLRLEDIRRAIERMH